MRNYRSKLDLATEGLVLPDGPISFPELWKDAGFTDEDVRLMQRLAEPSPPGQRPQGKRGRETKWTSDLHTRLIREVLELTGGKQSRKVSEACRILAAREPWCSLVTTSGSKRQPADVLRERYVRLWMASLKLYENVETGEVAEVMRLKHRKRGGKYHRPR